MNNVKHYIYVLVDGQVAQEIQQLVGMYGYGRYQI